MQRISSNWIDGILNMSIMMSSQSANAKEYVTNSSDDITQGTIGGEEK